MNINLNFKNLCSSLRELLKEKVDKSDLDKTNDNVSAVENSITDISIKIDEKVGTEDLNTALENKVDKELGKGLSSNDYTTDEKTKLAGIAEGANKYSLPTASASTLGGVKVGTNLSISNGVLSAKDTTYSVATTLADGLMSAADKTKLDGVATGANKYTLPAATSNALGGVMVDTALSETSTNPVQNKAVTTELNNIKSKTINGVALNSGQNLIVPRSSKSLLGTAVDIGKNGYIKFATLTVTGTYADHPHYIRLHVRNTSFALVISGEGKNEIDVTFNKVIVACDFTSSGNIFIYYKKVTNAVVDFYYLKRNGNDSLFVEDYIHADKYEGVRDKLEFKSEFTTTLPEGAVLIPTKADPDEIADSTACNLLNYYEWVGSKTAAGVTFTNNYDGTVTVNGTASEQATYYLQGGAILRNLLKPNTTYTLSGSPNGASWSTYFVHGYLIASGESVISDTPKTFNSGSSTDTNLNIAIIIRKGQTVSNLVFKPMLEEGSVAHSFVPFTGTTGKLNSDVAEIQTSLNTTSTNLTLGSDVSAGKITAKRVGNIINIIGTGIKPLISNTGCTLATLDTAFRPSTMNVTGWCSFDSGSIASETFVQVATNGTISINRRNAGLDTSLGYSFNITYII